MISVIEVPVRHWNEHSVMFKLTFYGVPFSEFLKHGQEYVTEALFRKGLYESYFADYQEARNITHSVEKPVPYIRRKRDYTPTDEIRTFHEKVTKEVSEYVSNHNRRYGK